MRGRKKATGFRFFSPPRQTQWRAAAAAGGPRSQIARRRPHSPVGLVRLALCLIHARPVLVQWLKRVAIAITQRIRQQESEATLGFLFLLLMLESPVF